MIRKIVLSALTALGLAASGPAHAAGGEAHVEDFSFSFEGPFGTYDQMQLQRGLQVYTEVCSACHGLRYVPFRALGYDGGPSLPTDQVRAYAEFYEVFDAELDDFRPAIPGAGSWATPAVESQPMAIGKITLPIASIGRWIIARSTGPNGWSIGRVPT